MAKVLVVINTPVNCVTITPCDDAGTATAPTRIVNMGQITEIIPVYEQNQYYDYQGQSIWGGTAAPGTPTIPDLLPLSPNWCVRLKREEDDFEQIMLTQWYGAPYANTQAGATAAITALSVAFP